MTYNPIIHCALLRNKLNRITPCWGLRNLGRYDCAGVGYQCPIARWWDEIKSKEKTNEPRVAI